MRILRRERCTGAAPNNRMKDNEFAESNNRVLSERAFWLGLALYAALFVAVTTVFGSTVPQTGTGFAWKANAADTLVLGIPEQAEINYGSGANHFLYQSHQTRGALTFRLYSPFGFGHELNRRALKDPLTPRALDPKIAELLSARTSAPRVNGPVVSRADDFGFTPMQIPLAEPGVFAGEEITPVPERATWFAAALVVGAITWSQRHRFIRSFALVKRHGAKKAYT